VNCENYRFLIPNWLSIGPVDCIRRDQPSLREEALLGPEPKALSWRNSLRPQSRSDKMIVAVGFNPRSQQGMSLRRGATLEPGSGRRRMERVPISRTVRGEEEPIRISKPRAHSIFRDFSPPQPSPRSCLTGRGRRSAFPVQSVNSTATRRLTGEMPAQSRWGCFRFATVTLPGRGGL
jgi:hypothetical protein